MICTYLSWLVIIVIMINLIINIFDTVVTIIIVIICSLEILYLLMYIAVFNYFFVLYVSNSHSLVYKTLPYIRVREYVLSLIWLTD